MPKKPKKPIVYVKDSFGLSVSLRLPVKVLSEANLREHWAVVNKRKQAQQEVIDVYFQRHSWCINEFKRWLAKDNSVVVTLCRIGKKKLDSDNLANGFKKVRDRIAHHLDVDDGNEQKITWNYNQVLYNEVGIEINITTTGESKDGKSE